MSRPYIFDSWGNFFDSGWGLAAIIAVTCLLVGVAIHQVDKGISNQCARIMSYAHTSRDSLDAEVACAKVKSDAATAMAIGAAAGAVAGSATRR